MDAGRQGKPEKTHPIIRRGPVLLLYLVATMLASNAAAGPSGFEKFYGEWVGTALSDTAGEIAPRDIRVKIGPQKQGFSVHWVLVIHKAAGKDKRSEFSVSFLPTKRPNIYGSAMRADTFGNPVPLDPLRGDPYMWARVDGSTLVVYALVITPTGGYEMHAYERTVMPSGVMNLKYFRVVDGEVLRAVTGTLTRTK